MLRHGGRFFSPKTVFRLAASPALVSYDTSYRNIGVAFRVAGLTDSVSICPAGRQRPPASATKI
jgi:hypothetical protein